MTSNCYCILHISPSVVSETQNTEKLEYPHKFAKYPEYRTITTETRKISKNIVEYPSKQYRNCRNGCPQCPVTCPHRSVGCSRRPKVK